MRLPFRQFLFEVIAHALQPVYDRGISLPRYGFPNLIEQPMLFLQGLRLK